MGESKQNNENKDGIQPSVALPMLDICGCGKKVKYTTSDGKGACNKYGRCPTYDELSEMLKQANLKLHQIKQLLDV